MKISTLTTAEEQLMKVLWKLDSAYMKNVLEAYPEPKPHANTISTFLKILVEKEFLTTTKEGRIFNYHVAVPFTDYRHFLLQNFIADYFDGSATDLQLALSEINPNSQPVSAETKELTSADSALSDFINELTGPKKKKKKEKKNKKKEKSKSTENINIKVKKHK